MEEWESIVKEVDSDGDGAVCFIFLKFFFLFQIKKLLINLIDFL